MQFSCKTGGVLALKVLKWFDRNAESAISSLLLLIMVSLAFLNVTTRYVINYSLAFTEELTVYLFVWMTLLGTSIAFRDNAHMKVTLFYEKFPPKVRRCVYLLIYTCCLGFFAMLAYYGGLQVLDEIEVGIGTESMQMPMAFFTSSIPIGSALIMFRIIGRVRKDLKENLY